MRYRFALTCLVTTFLFGSPGDLNAKTSGAPQWLLAHLRAQYRDDPDRRALRFGYALVDLNADGRDEALIYVSDGNCGTGGCGIEIMKRTPSGWRRVSETSIGWPPVRLLATKTRGWRDIGVVVAGGGVIPGYESRLRFDGRRYPFNPSVSPAERLPRGARGTIVIKDADRPVF